MELKQLIERFEQNGFEQIAVQLTTEVRPIYLKKKNEHYFLFDSTQQIDLDSIKECHAVIRKFTNKLYKLPKPFRIKTPNIVSLFLQSSAFSQEAGDFVVNNPPSTFIGGEENSIFLIDKEQQTIQSYGIRTMHIKGTPPTTRVSFDKIDPKNRAYHFVHGLFKQ